MDSVSKPWPEEQVCVTVQHSAHAHDFGQGHKKSAERRALLVTLLTFVTMAAEVVGGLLTGSMALLADGIHMAGHALALGLAAGAYYLARRHAHDRRLSLGSGKIGDLAAYTSGLLLALSTFWLVLESLRRLLDPSPLLAFEALLVALIGLVVNLLSAWLLAGDHAHLPGHDHHHHHEHSHHDHDHHHGHEHQDHNLQAALVHVLADVMTSLAAIIGLIAAWQWGWHWLDPVIALVASFVVLRWAVGLLWQTGSVLLDREGPEELRQQVRDALEQVPDSAVVDLHLWSVGQGTWTVMAAVVTHGRATPDTYKQALALIDGLHHPLVEVHYCTRCKGNRSAC